MNIRQFFTLLRQQRLFSGIYITSTALSTALTMTLFLVIYIMVGPVYPEQERSRMAILETVYYQSTDNSGNYLSGASMALADSLRNMPEVEWLTAIRSKIDGGVIGSDGKRIPCVSQPADDTYWRVFNFRFIQGRAFNRTEWESNSPVCVISEGMARKLFGHADMTSSAQDMEDSGLFVRLPDNSLRRVVGIVEDVSMATPMTSAQMWTPSEKNSDINTERQYIGRYTLVMLLPEGKTVEQLQERVARMEETINQELASSGSKYQLSLNGQPYTYWQFCLGYNEQSTTRKILGLLLAFLLIPAMNMGSMVASRINARTSEMGIRRAYGAGRMMLLWQVLQENFLLTLIGSLLGLAISWLIVTLGADWLLFIFNDDGRQMIDGALEPVQLHTDMLFSGWVVAAVLVATLALNLIATLGPALWILRKHVTEEINHKR